ncbi:sigma-54 dependent transcriptional regulator [Sphingomonas sp. TREG-RG-20F-R18-01]|uniref:sigma-54-dependent transcriptional regulator n=1 Tax=Sphingomonas sp. TREG-RG-20F-R18-01 TaxID=2914982 RepID=UPI001F59C5B8|nr:sigma-54 dependent transcriptional regulator [Sphingomonas sp. TREG-RG-20F-R18-01]
MTSTPPRVALIEDDEDLRVSTTQLLALAGFAVDAYPAAAPALAAITPDFAGVVVTDVRLPLLSGTELFHLLRTRDPTLPVILITAHGDVAMAVDSLKAGAWDFLTKPFDPDVLVAAVTRAATARALELENRTLRAAALAEADDGLIGQSPAIERLRAMIPTLADADIDLLIEGETGTGKALLARRIHAAGKRRRHRLLGVACAAYPDALLDGDLFARVGSGSVVAASRGTLLLDDLDQASRALQARLTALVEARALVTPGARDTIPIDLRVIATAAEEGARREDAIAPALLYRIAAVRLRIPPLRERREDIVPLFAHFVGESAARLGQPVPAMSGAAQHHLATHDWPGNVRELAHFAERFVLGLDAAVAAPDDRPQSLPTRLDAFERAAIIAAMGAANGEVGAAIEQLGIPRKTFYYRVKRLGIALGPLKRAG